MAHRQCDDLFCLIPRKTTTTTDKLDDCITAVTRLESAGRQQMAAVKSGWMGSRTGSTKSAIPVDWKVLYMFFMLGLRVKVDGS
ncbi:MAG: hypothetical protein ACI8RZ_003947 [Myxococcota bacterium]|jgi:hypothetical protein